MAKPAGETTTIIRKRIESLIKSNKIDKDSSPKEVVESFDVKSEKAKSDQSTHRKKIDDTKVKQQWVAIKKAKGWTTTKPAKGIDTGQIRAALAIVNEHFGGKTDIAIKQLNAIKSIGDIDDVLAALAEYEELKNL